MKARLRFLVLLSAALATTGMLRATHAAGADGQSTFGDLQIQSAPDGTEILLQLRSKVREEDRTQRRPGLSASGSPGRVATPALPPAAEETPKVEPTPTPMPEGAAKPEATPTLSRAARARMQVGSVTATEIHLFFPGATISRSRMITVDDRIVEEARLFPEEGGVSMTVVARRPIYYVVSHSGDDLNIHVEPATLLAAEPTGPIAAVERTPTGGARRRGQQRPGGGTGDGACVGNTMSLSGVAPNRFAPGFSQ
jgi:hypothetical protein